MQRFPGAVPAPLRPRFRLDRAKVDLIISSLSDRALDWAMATTRNNPQLMSDLPLFLNEFHATVDHPSGGADSAGWLHSITQGSRNAAEYTLEFRTLAADSGWGDVVLRSAYRRGLLEDIKDLIVRDQPPTLQDLITLVLLMDDRLRERRRERAQRLGNPPRSSGTRATGPDITTRSSRSTPPLPQSHNVPTRPPGKTSLCSWAGCASPRKSVSSGSAYTAGIIHLIQGCPVRPKDSAHLEGGSL